MPIGVYVRTEHNNKINSESKKKLWMKKAHKNKMKLINNTPELKEKRRQIALKSWEDERRRENRIKSLRGRECVGTGIYIRTEECNNAHKVKRSEEAKANMKKLRNRPEMKVKDKQAAIKRMLKETNNRCRNTKPERAMERLLLKAKFLISKQFWIKNVGFVDFYLPEENLVIEVDGNYWHKYPYGTDNDRQRDSTLRKLGYKILRFWETEVYNMEKINGK